MTKNFITIKRKILRLVIVIVMWIESNREQRSRKEYAMFTRETVPADIEGDNTASDPSYSMDNEDEIQNKKGKYNYCNIDLDISKG